MIYVQATNVTEEVSLVEATSPDDKEIDIKQVSLYCKNKLCYYKISDIYAFMCTHIENLENKKYK